MYWLEMEIFSVLFTYQLVIGIICYIICYIICGNIQGSLTDCEPLLNVQNRQTALFSATQTKKVSHFEAA